MNSLQVDIIKVILSIVSIRDFDRMYEDHTIRYGLLNYIAKYSLSNDYYLATEVSLQHVVSHGFLKDGALRRGVKSQKNGFTYEHPIPSSVTGRLVVENRADPDEVARILALSDFVVILTSDENDKFRRFGLTQKMPEGWCIEDGNPFARYVACGICDERPVLEVKMTGQIKR